MSTRRNHSPVTSSGRRASPPRPISSRLREVSPQTTPALEPPPPAWSHPDRIFCTAERRREGVLGVTCLLSATQEVAWLPGYNQGPWRKSSRNITREIFSFNAKICLKAINNIQLWGIHRSYLALNNTNLTGKLVFQVNQCITHNYSSHVWVWMPALWRRPSHI